LRNGPTYVALALWLNGPPCKWSGVEWIVSGSGISWARYKSAPRLKQITMPAPHHSVFYRPDTVPAAQPTASKH